VLQTNKISPRFDDATFITKYRQLVTYLRVGLSVHVALAAGSRCCSRCLKFVC